MHIADRQVPHAGGARDDADRYDSGGAAVGLSSRFAHLQLARHEPAVVRRQPGMIRRGVDQLFIRDRPAIEGIGRYADDIHSQAEEN